MRNNTALPLDAPEGSAIISALLYSIPCFFSLPFILLLLSIGSERDMVALSWLEIVFHGINLIIVLVIFREYLKFSFWTFESCKKDVFITAAITAAACLAMGVIWLWIYWNSGIALMNPAAFGTLPISEMDILILPLDTLSGNPILGTLVFSVPVPIVTCCLYYATAFPALYSRRPWLGYLGVALITAFPRLCNAVTFWYPPEELVLYLSRLPLHLMCCWAYQKTDTIWTPIFAHMLVNLVSCLLLLGLLYL